MIAVQKDEVAHVGSGGHGTVERPGAHDPDAATTALAKEGVELRAGIVGLDERVVVAAQIAERFAVQVKVLVVSLHEAVAGWRRSSLVGGGSGWTGKVCRRACRTSG